jgi:hypothetical protein
LHASVARSAIGKRRQPAGISGDVTSFAFEKRCWIVGKSTGGCEKQREHGADLENSTIHIDLPGQAMSGQCALVKKVARAERVGDD